MAPAPWNPLAKHVPPPLTKYHIKTYPAIDPGNRSLSAQGKNIVITGGGTGIGAATAHSFVRAGAANIALLGRRVEKLEATRKRIAEENGTAQTKVYVYVADVRDPESLHAALDAYQAAVGSAHSSLDVLISNAAAGDGVPTPIAEYPADAFWNCFETNVHGSFNAVRAFLPRASKDAAIINVNTESHTPALPGWAGYQSSKIASAKMFEHLAEELPAQTFVLNLQPGPTATEVWEGLEEAGFPIPDGYLAEVAVPGNFMVWVVSPAARFLRGKFVWANWDVGELMAMKDKIENSRIFTLGLQGWLQ